MKDISERELFSITLEQSVRTARQYVSLAQLAHIVRGSMKDEHEAKSFERFYKQEMNNKRKYG